MSALALCLGFTSCDNYEEPYAPAQSNPQEPVVEANGVAFALTSEGQAVIDLLTYDEQGLDVPLFDLTLTSEYPADYTLAATVQVAKDDTFGNYKEVNATVADGKVSVNPNDLQSAITAVAGKSPSDKVLSLRIAAYSVKDKSEARLGGADFYYGPYQVTVTPLPSDFVIEEAYYLLGTINGWDVATAVKFNHSDANQYDDPVFTLVVEITEDQAAEGWWWKIVPQSTYETGNWVDAPNAQYGVEEDGSEDLSGVLAAASLDETGALVNPGAGCIFEPGRFLLTINLEASTYDFVLAYENLYTPGGSNGWSFDTCQLLSTTDYTNYYGYVDVNGEFKFTSEGSWSATYNLGMGETEGTLANGSNTNISVAENGLYWVHVDLPALTYDLYHVTTIGVIGDATAGGWDASTALTMVSPLVWEGDITFGAGEWKFRANDAWDVNLGGTVDNLEQGGANLVSPGAGTYHVTLDLSTLPYSCTVE